MSSGNMRSFGNSGAAVTSANGHAVDLAMLGTRLTPAIERTRDHLLSLQQADGHWCAELQGDTILESEYILLLTFLGQGQSQKARECAAYMLDQQCDHGSWAMFPGGPIEISGSVKAYLALKITGHNPTADYMVRAREAIIRAGGMEQVNSFTRFYLAMLGIIPYDLCPAVPPEMIMLPKWAPFNIYEMSSWSRTIIVPLSLLWACQPKTTLPPEHQIDELYATPAKTLPRTIGGVNHEGSRGWLNWTKFFQKVDSAIKLGEGLGIKPLRKRAIKLCEQWILDRLKMSDGLGAIFPPIVWTIIGLRCLGYKDDSEVIVQQMLELDKLCIRENDQVRLQPCFSPVWDTIISMIALRDAGVSRHDPAIRKAIEWVLSKEVRHPGDWSLSHPNIEPGGWYFEYNNEFYPDIDDTCMALIALGKCLPEGAGREWTMEVFDEPKTGGTVPQNSDSPVVFSGRSANAEKAIAELEAAAPMVNAIRRGVRWLKSMQSSDGGWGAFDADNTREVLTKVPFADHNAMIDPSTSDITARVLESFAGLGIPADGSIHKRAFDFIWNDQQPDHCWYGRWGVNYLYGTWQVLVGLTANGIPASDPRLQKAVEWLKAKQQSCGGWGETARSYDDPSLRGTGIPTASQTAWALLGLIAAGEANSVAVQRGVDYLLTTQQPNGTWTETEFTGTGFPRVFYLRYHYYSLYFPLMALARYAKATVGHTR
jgi:squalene-hopene/tetraprenyl-beta-curcumene cyclase